MMFIYDFLKKLVKRNELLSTVYRSFRDHMEVKKPPVDTPWGFRFAGNESMSKGLFEPLETSLVRKCLQDADVVVNIGANVGYYCCHAQSMQRQVIAFEPVPRNLRFLCGNMKINGWTDIEIFPMALSDKPGILEIYGADTGASLVKGWAGTPDDYVSLVPASTLDIVLGERLNGKKILVLIDVEGAEYSVLRGATTLINSTPKPIWMIEISSDEHQPAGRLVNPDFARTFQLMWDAGYTAYTADSEMREVYEADVAAVQAGDVQRLSTHNFIFK